MLEIQNVCKQYPGTNKQSLSNINLTIEDGEFICIVGPSGCGKTTLLNLVAGLELPTEGTLMLDGQPITGPGADRVVMFQEAALYPWKNVLENVMLGMEFIKVPKEEREKRAKYYLNMVHLGEFTDYPIHQLSGGMKQRVALARALSMDSKLLLMDEPFSALDKQTTNILRGELEQIWMRQGKTILFVTHSVEEAVYFADRIIVLSEHPGKIKEIFPCSLSRPRNTRTPEFVALRHQILDAVKREVMEVEKSDYDEMKTTKHIYDNKHEKHVKHEKTRGEHHEQGK